MIVHFIGGPRHGETEAFSGIPYDRIRVPHNVQAVSYAYREGQLPPISAPYDIAEYAVIKRERYAIAEFIEPMVRTRWSVDVSISDVWNDRVYNAFSRLITERKQILSPSGVRFGNAVRYSSNSARLDFLIVVDGPPDVTATRLAAEKLESWLAKQLPRGVVVTNVHSAADSE